MGSLLSPKCTRGLRLIITADDFGRDAVCTAAITENLVSGKVTAASIMANGSHFAEACARVHEHGLVGAIGVHLSLDEGRPISHEMLGYTDAKGYLCLPRSLMPLGSGLSHAVEAELAAQIEQVLAAGIRPTHLDSHRHAHTAFPVARLVVRLARRYGIPYVRPARNLACRNTLAARMYKRMFNRYLASQTRTADYFGDIVDFYRQGGDRVTSGMIECMIHLDDSARGLEGGRLLNDEGFQRFLGKYELIRHDEASY